MHFTHCGWPSSVLLDLKRDLHQDHGGVVVMKAIACSYMVVVYGC